MKKSGLVLSILGSLFTTSLAQADPASECGNKVSSQVALSNCLVEVATNVNATIKDALEYATYTAKELDQVTTRSEAVPALTQSQDSWAAYREAHCNFVGSMFGGGSGTGIAIQNCRIQLGRLRATELMSYSE